MKKLAVVIGGSSGIGYAICHDLKDEYTVVNMSRRENTEVNNIYCDVSDYNSIQKAFSELMDKYGVPYYLIYCAGFVNPQSILEIDKETLEKTIYTNLFGAFYCTQCFVRLKNDNECRKIIYIASTAGTRSQPGWSAYSTSKAGLINLGLTMSSELHDYNIKVYTISPGRCATSLRRILAINENQALIMQPEQVSQFIKYLIQEDNVLDNQNIIIKQQ